MDIYVYIYIRAPPFVCALHLTMMVVCSHPMYRRACSTNSSVCFARIYGSAIQTSMVGMPSHTLSVLTRVKYVEHCK